MDEGRECDERQLESERHAQHVALFALGMVLLFVLSIIIAIRLT